MSAQSGNPNAIASWPQWDSHKQIGFTYLASCGYDEKLLEKFFNSYRYVPAQGEDLETQYANWLSDDTNFQ